KVSTTRHADSSVGAAKSFSRGVSSRFPIIATELQFNRARFILAEKFDAAHSHLLSPFVAHAFVFGKVVRSGDNQPRPHGLEKLVGTRATRMMLAFNQNVAS